MIESEMNSFQYGLYDRPELKSWFKGRVVLLGDAAHPTSPVCDLAVDVHGAK
jgi:salicylate hydroxylase